MNKWNLVLAVSLAAAAACAQADVLLKVEGPGAGLDGRALYLDGNAIGVVGDTISISSAPHRLAVDLPQGIRDIKEIRTVDGQLQARSLENEACAGNAAWSIAAPKPPDLVNEGGVEVLHLNSNAPRYEGPCDYGLPNLQCYAMFTTVVVSSAPEVNAEIWFDGTPLSQRTSSSVEVRYCDGFATTIAVLIRKPGYVNCMTSFPLPRGDHSPSAPQAVTCPMQTVQDAAAKAAGSQVTPSGLVAAGDRRDAAK